MRFGLEVLGRWKERDDFSSLKPRLEISLGWKYLIPQGPSRMTMTPECALPLGLLGRANAPSDIR
jgi:hypothetical protein